MLTHVWQKRPQSPKGLPIRPDIHPGDFHRANIPPVGIITSSPFYKREKALERKTSQLKGMEPRLEFRSLGAHIPHSLPKHTLELQFPGCGVHVNGPARFSKCTGLALEWRICILTGAPGGCGKALPAHTTGPGERTHMHTLLGTRRGSARGTEGPSEARALKTDAARVWDAA